MKRIEIVAGLVLAVLLAVAISTVSSWYIGSRQNESRGILLTNASAGIATGTSNDQAQAVINTGLAAGRTDFQATKAKAKKDDPETADRADRAVPVSVRNAYTARRLARERLGCAGRECP